MVVHYKFKSSTNQSRVQFVGATISVLDLKHSILQDCGLVKGRDVLDLELSDADTGVVYENDTSVGRDKAVLVKRVPIVRREALVSQRGDTSIDLDGEHDV